MNCPQCGKPYSERACGPTHALMAQEEAGGPVARLHAPRPICEVCRDTGGVQLPCAVHPPDNGPGCSCELEEVSCEYCELGSLDRQLRTAGRMLRAMLDAVEAQSHE